MRIQYLVLFHVSWIASFAQVSESQSDFQHPEQEIKRVPNAKHDPPGIYQPYKKPPIENIYYSQQENHPIGDKSQNPNIENHDNLYENPLIENNVPAFSKAENDVVPITHEAPNNFETLASINIAATVTEEQSVDTVDPIRKKTLLEEFRRDEKEYALHPPYPPDTRRFFDPKPETEELRIASITRLKALLEKENLGEPLKKWDETCEPQAQVCNANQQFRSLDGTCNNIQHPTGGSSMSPYLRFMKPDYEDDRSLPRGVISYSRATGYVSRLPSPRVISDNMFKMKNETETEHHKNSHMMMQWGQFIGHDMTMLSKEAFDCCQEAIKNLERCFPIKVDEKDTFFSQFNRKCLDFTRSNQHCSSRFKMAEQFNMQTAFIDGSAVYGADQEMGLLLRGGNKRSGGRLTVNSKLSNFLPCNFDLQRRRSELDLPTDFVTGDGRTEVQSSLTAIHNLFLNEHNRIADIIYPVLSAKGKLSPLQLDELVYQETRKIVVAEIQHITFTQFLPQILGEKRSKDVTMNAEQSIYNPKAHPGIFNSFAAAAFRFGHSMIQSIFNGEGQPWKLGRFFGDSRFAMGKNGTAYKNELLGLSKQSCQKVDMYVTKQMTEVLYANNKSEEGRGHDIVAINIQRGRDHGIPSYNTFRKFCGLPTIQSISVKPNNIAEENWKNITRIYKHHEDIDLFVGGLAETIITDGLVGDTFACIIERQFLHIKASDRFFYSHTEGADIHPVSGKMREEIQSRKLSQIICEVTGIEEISHNVFVQESIENVVGKCGEMKKMDIHGIAMEIANNLEY